MGGADYSLSTEETPVLAGFTGIGHFCRRFELVSMSCPGRNGIAAYYRRRRSGACHPYYGAASGDAAIRTRLQCYKYFPDKKLVRCQRG